MAAKRKPRTPRESLDETLSIIDDQKQLLIDTTQEALSAEKLTPGTVAFGLQTLIQVAKFELELIEKLKTEQPGSFQGFPGMPIL